MARALPETHESLWRMIFGLLVWAAHFLLSYVTGAIACAKFVDAQDEIGLARVLVALYTVLALALIGWSARTHWRRHRRGRSMTPADDAGNREDRQRFLGLAGLLLCGLSAVAVIYTAAVAVMIRGCA